MLHVAILQLHLLRRAPPVGLPSLVSLPASATTSRYSPGIHERFWEENDPNTLRTPTATCPGTLGTGSTARDTTRGEGGSLPVDIQYTTLKTDLVLVCLCGAQSLIRVPIG